MVGKEKEDVLKELRDGRSQQEDLQIPTGQYFLQTQDGQIIQVRCTAQGLFNSLYICGEMLD